MWPGPILLPAKYGRYASHAEAFQNLCVRYFVLPLGAQNAPQAPQVKAVEFLPMSRVSGPCLTAIEECAERAGLVDMQLGLLCEVDIVPDPLVQSGHDRCCLGDPTVYLNTSQLSGCTHQWQWLGGSLFPEP